MSNSSPLAAQQEPSAPPSLPKPAQMARARLGAANDFLLSMMPVLAACGGLAPIPVTPDGSPDPLKPAPSRRPHCPRGRAGPQELGIPARSQFPSDIEGKTLLVIDGENIAFTLKRAGLKLDWGAFMQVLGATVPALQAHAYSTASEECLDQVAQVYEGAGIDAHVRPKQTVHTFHGHVEKANSDHDILLGLGMLLQGHLPDNLILASGDGDLGTAVAHFCASFDVNLIICGVPGATSARLRKRNNAQVAGNIWLGRELMLPLVAGSAPVPAPIPSRQGETP
ncbi:NYN domain-containing protein [Massilia glaciei]|nr:NYN domain-containing protein [Massilia glaciei]